MIELDDSQRAAVNMAAREPICIVTGGPGTGKTTIVRTLLDELAELGDDVRVALCAPTGKAAKRLAESTEREAKTIHRLLGFNPIERGFFHNARNPLAVDVVICDESSMIDVELFADLLEAIDPSTTRLVLVGDANQLPSVGPGAILADLVGTSSIPCARLTRVHRSAAESWICNSAPRVLDGLPLDLEDRDDFRYVEVDEAANVPRVVGNVLEEYAGAQVLVPQKTGKAGTDAINAAVQERFNPSTGGAQWGRAPNLLRAGDRVIHVRNNYELGVFNGEVGTVASIDDDAGALFVEFPDRVGAVTYSKGDAMDLRLAYALTIHKSQGSEWPWVVVVVHNTHSFMLTRQLFYTAITRGKAGVVLVGNTKGIGNALKSERDKKRNTALAERIRGEL